MFLRARAPMRLLAWCVLVLGAATSTDAAQPTQDRPTAPPVAQVSEVLTKTDAYFRQRNERMFQLLSIDEAPPATTELEDLHQALKALPDRQDEWLATTARLARVRLVLNRQSEAAELAQQVVASLGRRKTSLPDVHAEAWSVLGIAALTQKDWPRATASLKQSLAILRASERPDIDHIAKAQYALGLALFEAGQHELALTELDSALLCIVQRDGPNAARSGLFLRDLARLRVQRFVADKSTADAKIMASALAWLDYLERHSAHSGLKANLLKGLPELAQNVASYIAHKDEASAFEVLTTVSRRLGGLAKSEVDDSAVKLSSAELACSPMAVPVATDATTTGGNDWRGVVLMLKSDSNSVGPMSTGRTWRLDCLTSGPDAGAQPALPLVADWLMETRTYIDAIRNRTPLDTWHRLEQLSYHPAAGSERDRGLVRNLIRRGVACHDARQYEPLHRLDCQRANLRLALGHDRQVRASLLPLVDRWQAQMPPQVTQPTPLQLVERLGDRLPSDVFATLQEMLEFERSGKIKVFRHGLDATHRMIEAMVARQTSPREKWLLELVWRQWQTWFVADAGLNEAVRDGLEALPPEEWPALASYVNVAARAHAVRALKLRASPTDEALAELVKAISEVNEFSWSTDRIAALMSQLPANTRLPYASWREVAEQLHGRLSFHAQKERPRPPAESKLDSCWDAVVDDAKRRCLGQAWKDEKAFMRVFHLSQPEDRVHILPLLRARLGEEHPAVMSLRARLAATNLMDDPRELLALAKLLRPRKESWAKRILARVDRGLYTYEHEPAVALPAIREYLAMSTEFQLPRDERTDQDLWFMWYSAAIYASALGRWADVHEAVESMRGSPWREHPLGSVTSAPRGVKLGELPASHPLALAGLRKDDVVRSLCGHPPPKFIEADDARRVLLGLPISGLCQVAFERDGTPLTVAWAPAREEDKLGRRHPNTCIVGDADIDCEANQLNLTTGLLQALAHQHLHRPQQAMSQLQGLLAAMYRQPNISAKVLREAWDASVSVALQQDPSVHSAWGKWLMDGQGELALREDRIRALDLRLAAAHPKFARLLTDAAAASTEAQVAGPGQADAARRLSEIDAEVERVRVELAGDATLAQVKARVLAPLSKLSPSEAYVAMLSYRPLKTSAPGATQCSEHGCSWALDFSSPRVLAVVARGSQVVLRDLGSRAELDSVVKRFRTAILSRMPVEPIAAELAAAVWHPVRDAIGSAETIYLRLDAPLDTAPFAALRIDGHWLVEKHELIYTDSLQRSLAWKQASARKEPLERVTVLAAPAFNTLPESKTVPDGTLVGLVRAKSWTGLPGAERESAAVRLLVGDGASVRTGKAATEQALRSGVDAQVLHLATHGFYLPRPNKYYADQLAGRDCNSDDDDSDCADWIAEEAAKDAPYRAGILLAGARDLGRPPSDDGVVTAKDVMSLNLSRVQLAVLSACQTGLGASERGEGLSGLPRAFHLAGVPSLVATRWEVDDAATAAWMKQFYAHLKRGLSFSASVREAQLALLRDGVEQADADASRGFVMQQTESSTRRSSKNQHPYFWAPFVLHGANGGFR